MSTGLCMKRANYLGHWTWRIRWVSVHFRQIRFELIQMWKQENESIYGSYIHSNEIFCSNHEFNKNIFFMDRFLWKKAERCAGPRCSLLCNKSYHSKLKQIETFSKLMDEFWCQKIFESSNRCFGSYYGTSD